MNVTEMQIPDVLLITPRIFKDSRGYFLETHRTDRYLETAGIPAFVQDNLSVSTRGVLRGLHYQLGQPQGKLVTAIRGKIFDVAVDIRRGSPTYGKWVGVTLSEEDHRQIYIPPGFAHGFCVVSEEAAVLYKCTDYYAPEEERGIRWDDPILNIDWPIHSPGLSIKDAQYPSLDQVPRDQLPIFQERR